MVRWRRKGTAVKESFSSEMWGKVERAGICVGLEQDQSSE